MGDKTKIEWTRGEDGREGASWNPIRARNIATGKIGWHCTHASEGCRHCYAETWNKPRGTGLDYTKQNESKVEIFLDEKMLMKPLQWKRPRTIFVGSMTDIFGDFVSDDMLDKIFAVATLATHHTFIMLTKRADRMKRYLNDAHRQNSIRQAMVGLGRDEALIWWPLPNVWLGVSAEDQKTLDERAPLLLATPAAVRLLSLEPLLGPIDFKSRRENGTHLQITNLLTGSWQVFDEDHYRHGTGAGIDWVIVGGESGRNARPCPPRLFRSLRDQCIPAGVAYFHKQNGEYVALPEAFDHGITPEQIARAKHEVVEGLDMIRVGKKAAGRLLDGRTWDEMPGRATVITESSEGERG